jgi:DNA polymerase-3 subunit delta
VRLSPDALAGSAGRELRGAYLVAGAEPLLILESCDLLRARARAAGHADREVHFIGKGFDWTALQQSAANLSLFGDRRLIELKLDGAPDAAGAAALAALAQRPPEDSLLLVSAELGYREMQANWVGAFETHAVLVTAPAVGRADLPAWIRARLGRQQVAIDDDALALLAERVEGNLLAASQAVDRIALLSNDGRAGLEEVAAIVADSARYDVFALAAASFAGETARALRILTGLRAEGIEPPLVLWALVSDLRLAAKVEARVRAGERVDGAFAAERVYASRQAPMRKALQRLDRGALERLLRRAADTDRMAKGSLRGDPWVALEALVAGIGGLKLAA